MAMDDDTALELFKQLIRECGRANDLEQRKTEALQKILEAVQSHDIKIPPGLLN